MNPLIARLAHEASAPVEDMLQRLIRTAALVALAAACAIAASAFLTIDLYLYLESIWGSLIAAASIGGAYLVFAGIFLLIALRRPARTPSSDAAAAEPVAPFVKAQTQPFAAASLGAASLGAEAAAAPAPRNREFAANIDTAVAPVLNVLRDAGLDKEVIAIEAGVEVAKQLNPLALTAFAAGAGLFLGRTLRGRRLF